MAVYIVTWNLNKEGASYSKARAAFLEQLNKYDHKADSGLETVRWVSTTSSAAQVSDFLRQKLDDDDRLFVSKLHSGCHAGWLEKDVWAWIDARL